MAGAAMMKKMAMPAMAEMPEPPTELRINAKKYKTFSGHHVGDKVSFSGDATVHHVSEGKDYHDVTLHIGRLKKYAEKTDK